VSRLYLRGWLGGVMPGVVHLEGWCGVLRRAGWFGMRSVGWLVLGGGARIVAMARA
jgi:hypothetical protein